MTKRIGFACKYIHPDQTTDKKELQSITESLNQKGTTIAFLNRQEKAKAEEKLWDIMVHNIQSLQDMLQYLVTLPEELRMMRIGSTVLPAYTEPSWSYFWKRADVVDYCSKNLLVAGNFARKHNIRLSMHPGQFTVLASDRPDVVENSIQEMEYHGDLIRWMGYGVSFQDFKCNVHISGKLGPDGIKAIFPRLSEVVRNTMTIENDENSWGLESSLELSDTCALVVDIHHHWVRTGEYIAPNDDRMRRVVDSWRGVRPVIHYSYSRDEHLPSNFKHDTMPDMERLLAAGHKKQKLRAHSDFFPNRVVNQYALSFLKSADIMCESKMKNLASAQLYEQMQGCEWIK